MRTPCAFLEDKPGEDRSQQDNCTDDSIHVTGSSTEHSDAFWRVNQESSLQADTEILDWVQAAQATYSSVSTNPWG